MRLICRLMSHQEPEKGSQRHNTDPAHLEEQGQKKNAPLVEHFMDGNDSQSCYADGTRSGKQGVDEREMCTQIIKKWQ